MTLIAAWLCCGAVGTSVAMAIEVFTGDRPDDMLDYIFSLVKQFVIGVFIGPISFLAVLYVLYLAATGQMLKKCPFCRNHISQKASVCQHCHRNV